MSWAGTVETTTTHTHTATIELSATSSVSKSDAELRLANILRTAADDIERDVDRARSVMAP